MDEDVDNFLNAVVHFAGTEDIQALDMIDLARLLVEALKGHALTVEQWELMKMSVQNAAAIFNTLADEEIIRMLQAEEPA